MGRGKGGRVVKGDSQSMAGRLVTCALFIVCVPRFCRKYFCQINTRMSCHLLCHAKGVRGVGAWQAARGTRHTALR